MLCGSLSSVLLSDAYSGWLADVISRRGRLFFSPFYEVSRISVLQPTATSREGQGPRDPLQQQRAVCETSAGVEQRHLKTIPAPSLRATQSIYHAKVTLTWPCATVRIFQLKRYTYNYYDFHKGTNYNSKYKYWRISVMPKYQINRVSKFINKKRLTNYFQKIQSYNFFSLSHSIMT